MDGTPQSIQQTDDFSAPAGMPLRGIDHLAIVTDDLEGTLDFYTRVLRMQLVHVRRVPYAPDRGQPPYDQLRHYFFDMGNDSLFAVFEYPKGVPKANRDHIGGMQHVAFHTPHRRFDEIRAHVRDSGVEITEPIDLGDGFLSVYFYDNKRHPAGNQHEGGRLRSICSTVGTADPVHGESGTGNPVRRSGGR